jgi:hypothetical protein
MKSILVILVLLVLSLSANDEFYYQNGKKVSLKFVMMPLSRGVESLRFYKNEHGVLLGISKRLIVKLKDGAVLDSYLKEFDLQKVKTLGKNLYLLETKDRSLSIDVANKLYEKDDVEYAHPDFIKKRKRR